MLKLWNVFSDLVAFRSIFWTLLRVFDLLDFIQITWLVTNGEIVPLKSACVMSYLRYLVAECFQVSVRVPRVSGSINVSGVAPVSRRTDGSVNNERWMRETRGDQLLHDDTVWVMRHPAESVRWSDHRCDTVWDMRDQSPCQISEMAISVTLCDMRDEPPCRISEMVWPLVWHCVRYERSVTLPNQWDGLTIGVTLCEIWEISHPAKSVRWSDHWCDTVWDMRDQSPCQISEMAISVTLCDMRDEPPCRISEMVWPLVWHCVRYERSVTLPNQWDGLTIGVTLCEIWEISHPAKSVRWSDHWCDTVWDMRDQSPCRISEMVWPSVWHCEIWEISHPAKSVRWSDHWCDTVWDMRDQSPCQISEMVWPLVWHCEIWEISHPAKSVRWSDHWCDTVWDMRDQSPCQISEMVWPSVWHCEIWEISHPAKSVRWSDHWCDTVWDMRDQSPCQISEMVWPLVWHCEIWEISHPAKSVRWSDHWCDTVWDMRDQSPCRISEMVWPLVWHCEIWEISHPAKSVRWSDHQCDTVWDMRDQSPCRISEMAISVTLCEWWKKSRPANLVRWSDHWCDTVWVMRDQSPCQISEMVWPSVWHCVRCERLVTLPTQSSLWHHVGDEVSHPAESMIWADNLCDSEWWVTLPTRWDKLIKGQQ